VPNPKESNTHCHFDINFYETLSGKVIKLFPTNITTPNSSITFVLLSWKLIGSYDLKVKAIPSMSKIICSFDLKMKCVTILFLHDKMINLSIHSFSLLL